MGSKSAFPLLIAGIILLNMVSSCAQPEVYEPRLMATASSTPIKGPTSHPTETPTLTPTVTHIRTPTQLWSSKGYTWRHVQLIEETETMDLYMGTTVAKCLAVTIQYETNGSNNTLSQRLCGQLYADPNDPDFIRTLQDKIFEARKRMKEFADLPKFNTTQLQENLLSAEDSPTIYSYMEDFYGDTLGSAYLVTKNEQYAQQFYECCSTKEDFEARSYFIRDERYYVLEKFISLPDGGYYGGGGHFLNLIMNVEPSEEIAKELFYVFEFPDKYWVAVIPIQETFGGLTFEDVYKLPDGKQITDPGKKTIYPVPVKLFGKY